METVLGTSGMRSADRFAIKKLGVPQAVLMENAGRSVAEAAKEIIGGGRGASVTVVCGKGNNGGDGIVAARHLLAGGVDVRVVLLARYSDLRGETRRQYSILRRISLRKGTRGRLSFSAPTRKGLLTSQEKPSVVIDAIIGTGFHGRVRGPARRAIEWINGAGCPVISVDIPSGLNSDDGSAGNACVRADLCITMGALKTGLLIGQGPEYAREIRIEHLGVGVTNPATPADSAYLIDSEDLRVCLPRRARDAHKHSVGKILILAGSVGLTGAAALAAEAAMRCGAGAVVLGVPRSIYPILAKKLTEVMVKPLPESPEATLCADSLADVKTELEWADVILTGPGLGRSAGARAFIENLLKLRNKRFLFDADGLNHLAGRNRSLSRLKRNTCILTPHVGEFSRLSGFSKGEIEQERVTLPGKFARKYGITLVLKGSPTVTANHAGVRFINSTGNPGMATAGMGDVLSGIIAALWAGGCGADESAYCGVYLHGRAGNLANNSLGQRSILARDVLNKLPEVITSFDFGM